VTAASLAGRRRQQLVFSASPAPMRRQLLIPGKAMIRHNIIMPKGGRQQK